MSAVCLGAAVISIVKIKVPSRTEKLTGRCRYFKNAKYQLIYRPWRYISPLLFLSPSSFFAQSKSDYCFSIWLGDIVKSVKSTEISFISGTTFSGLYGLKLLTH